MMWQLSFAYPWFLYTLGPGVCMFFLARWRWYKGVLYRYPLATEFYQHALVSRIPRRAFLAGIRFLILLFLVCLIAKPQLIDPRSCVEIEGIDIMLALDVSGSMSLPHGADDSRRRIDVAKEEAIRFINKRSHDALGLVLFGNDAISRCPLTTDKRVLLDIMEEIDLGIVPHEGTVITKALLTALNRLRYSTAKSKVIILLTDGEPTQNDLDPRVAIKAAQELNVKIYTIGIGDTQDFSNHPIFGALPVVTRVNTQLLSYLAQETGGKFFLAKHPDEMRRIYSTIDSLEKSRIDVPLFTRRYDWFIPLLWCVLALIVSEVCMASCLWFGL